MHRTLVLQEPDLGGESRSVLFEHFAQVLLGESGRSVVKMEDFARRLEPIFGRHVRVEKSVVLAVDVALEGGRAVRQVVRHRHVRQKGLLGITASKRDGKRLKLKSNRRQQQRKVRRLRYLTFIFVLKKSSPFR